MQKVMFLHLLKKKILCVTKDQLSFSDLDDNFEYSSITRAQLSFSLEKVNFAPSLNNLLL